jgi:hypothetical protein
LDGEEAGVKSVLSKTQVNENFLSVHQFLCNDPCSSKPERFREDDSIRKSQGDLSDGL